MTQPSPEYQRLTRLIGRVLDPYTQAVLAALVPILMNKEPVTMADIQQALADLGSAVQGVSDRTASDVESLKTEIEALKAQGVDTAALQAVADSIESQVEKLNQIDPVADVPVEETPAPEAPVVDEPAAPAEPEAPAAE